MSRSVGRLSGHSALLGGAALGLVTILAIAMPPAARAQGLVQAVPVKPAAARLNDALGQLARKPQDLEALIAAGRASLELGDVQAAIGFFQRADMLWPGSARIKAGLAGAYAVGADPITAIALFGEAEKLGPIDGERLADRGLAFDLVGDNQTAQSYYRQGLTLAKSDETLRRLALSLAIAGDRRGMESTLSPLLQRQDKAAWRTRAFSLAILGQADEAESIAHQTMPQNMADSITAYLRYMPRLTGAQQAAAANLGQFPRAAEMGHDDPRFARYLGPRARLAAATPAALPGRADGKSPDKTQEMSKDKAKDKAKDRAKDRPNERTRPADPGQQLAAAAPAPVVPSPPVSRELDPVPQLARAEAAPRPAPIAAASPARALTPLPAPLPTPAPLPAPTPTPLPAPVAPPIAAPVATPAAVSRVAVSAVPEPGFASIEAGLTKAAETFDLRQQPKSSGKAAPRPAAAAVGESIDEAFADFTPPSREVEPQTGAVDLRKLERMPRPADQTVASKAADKAKPGDKPRLSEKEKAKEAKDAKDAKDAKAARDTKLSQPSRVWVQVATGRDKTALGSDWRKLVKQDPAVFKGKKPFLTAWGQSNRLLAGPFESQKEAAAFLAAMKKAGVSGGFAWTSAAGQTVDPLSGAK